MRLGFAIALVLLSYAATRAEGAPLPEMVADRVAMQLTGKPAPDGLRQAYARGELSLDALLEALRATPDFERHLARYYLDVLKLQDVIDVRGIRNLARAGTVDEQLNVQLNRGAPPENAFLISAAKGDYTPAKLREAGQTMKTLFEAPNVRFRRVTARELTCTGGIRRQVHFVNASSATTIAQVVRGAAGTVLLKNTEGVSETVALSAAQKNEFTTINTWVNRYQNCTCDQAVDVAPFWDPRQRVKACPGLTEAAVCGPNLANCFTSDTGDLGVDPANTYLQQVNYGFTLEPAMLIAKVVAEQQSFDEVLRTTRGLLTGAQMHFMRKFGKVVLDVQPPGSYPNFAADAAAKANPIDDQFHWVERGPLHAGVLTTFAFHRATNGWRAKANRTVGTFLCREFTVPADTKQVASPEADLTRKPYCQNCHAVLEPLSQFFGRWPTLGKDSNYYYDATPSVSAVGSFNGEVDADTSGLARVLTNMRAFDECAVKRAFEFTVGRPMTEAESSDMLAPLTSAYQADEKRLWNVMKRIVGSPAFTGSMP